MKIALGRVQYFSMACPHAQSEVHEEMIFATEELSPDLNPIQHFWDELERRPRARPYDPASVMVL